MVLKPWLLLVVALSILALPEYTSAQPKTSPTAPILISADGQLTYKPNDKGDRVPDFSYCGYRLSEVPIPDVAVKVVVPPGNGDATQRIQAAIDYVSSLPLDKEGFRGTVLLQKGTYDVGGSLAIRSSGVVLRGSGSGPGGTILLGTGTDRETLIRVSGVNDQRKEAPVPLADTYFPVNATRLTFKSNHRRWATGSS